MDDKAIVPLTGGDRQKQTRAVDNPSAEAHPPHLPSDLLCAWQAASHEMVIGKQLALLTGDAVGKQKLGGVSIDGALFSIGACL